MRLLAGEGDTWGISGPAFLVIYLTAAAAAVVYALVVRRRVARGGKVSRELHPYEVAYLAGGPRRAIGTALAVLHSEGVIGPAPRGRLGVTGRPRTESAMRHPLDDAVYEALRQAEELRVYEIAHRHVVDTALDGLRAGLERDGLAISAGDRAAARLATLPLWMLFALGMARLVAGVANDKPVLFLVLALIAIPVAGFVLLAMVPKRSPAGQAAMAEARQRHVHLRPEVNPAWATYGVTGVAMGVALFGTTAMMNIDPAFAEETILASYLGTARTAGAGGSSSCGGGGGGSCGGSSSGDSGGGGGGCGGGGCGG